MLYLSNDEYLGNSSKLIYIVITKNEKYFYSGNVLKFKLMVCNICYIFS